MDPDELRLLAYLADSDFRSLSDQLCSLVWEEAQRRGLVEASKGQPVRSGSHAATRVTKELRGKVAEELIDIYYQLRLGEERNDTLDFGAAADRILNVVQRHRRLRMPNCFTWIASYLQRESTTVRSAIESGSYSKRHGSRR